MFVLVKLPLLLVLRPLPRYRYPSCMLSFSDFAIQSSAADLKIFHHNNIIFLLITTSVLLVKLPLQLVLSPLPQYQYPFCLCFCPQKVVLHFLLFHLELQLTEGWVMAWNENEGMRVFTLQLPLQYLYQIYFS